MARKKAARATGRKAAAKTGRKTRKPAAARKKSAKPLKKKASGAATKARSLARAASRRVKKATGKARKAVVRASGTARKAVRKASSQARKTVKKASSQARKTVKKASSQTRKTVKKAARPATTRGRRSASSRNPAAKVARKAIASVKAVKAGVTAAFSAPPPAPKPSRAPTLDRARKTVAEAEPPRSAFPSSLDYDPHGSAARTGREELAEKLHNHTSTNPTLSAGDVDADWASAESSGDETPGGDNPTPDQDVVDEIGRALGVEYNDDEELQGGAEITERDHHRWELDPASKDDDEEEKD